jgi:hypothetical protein
MALELIAQADRRPTDFSRVRRELSAGVRLCAASEAGALEGLRAKARHGHHEIPLGLFEIARRIEADAERRWTATSSWRGSEAHDAEGGHRPHGPMGPSSFRVGENMGALFEDSRGEVRVIDPPIPFQQLVGIAHDRTRTSSSSELETS